MTAELTLVMLTHNRPDFFRRALSYYGYFGFPIVVLDSSEDSNENVTQRYADVSYCHRPGETFLKKINYGLSKVDTPFMVFLSDDDFVLLPALNSSVEFLQSSPEYTFCHGYCLMYLPEAGKIHYFYRDKKVCEDYASDDPRQRVLSFMGQYIPPFYAVTRTEIIKKWYSLVPEDVGFEFQEVGQAIYYLYSGKARILSIPYIVRESNYIESEHGTDMYRALVSSDQKYVDMRQHFVTWGSKIFAVAEDDSSLSIRRFLLEAMSAAANCLASGRSLTLQEIFTSEWPVLAVKPVWTFAPTQFVEMPFYNKEFFTLLEGIDFLLRTMPYGKLQREQLKTVLANQNAVLAELNEQGGEKALSRLIPKISSAFQAYPFYRDMAVKLHELFQSGAAGLELLNGYEGWVSRINDAPRRAALTAVSNFNQEVRQENRLKSSPASIQNWLESRTLSKTQKDIIGAYLSQSDQRPSFGIVLLDLGGEAEKLNASLASLRQSQPSYIDVQLVIMTVNEVVAYGAAQVCQVKTDNWLAQLNNILSRSNFEWFTVVLAGDEFTVNGLLMAGLELLVSPECRAVYCDEIYRQADGNLGVAFRPAFNLDYLLSFPAGMARHWLFRRDVFLEAGCFNTQFPDAFEFEFILRLVNQGGLAGLGHISEPLVITKMPALENIEGERQAIVQHLQARGYTGAQVSAERPGRYCIRYKHTGNPVVSVLIPAGEHLSKVQRCVEGLLGSTAYQTFEILLIENHPLDQAVHEWLLALAELQEAKLRVVQPSSKNTIAMLNDAANQASGDYLLFLAPDTAILEDDWLDNLLNHAQRAEVGGVGARLLTPDGNIAQAMQILGLEGPLGNPYVGEKLDEPGYMQRLQVDQNVSALSQDCLMLPRDLYVQLGGLDEEGIPPPYAITDLCLRIREAGYLLVWSPSVQLMLDRQGPTLVSAQQQDDMYAKWLPQLARDPAYNSNFSLAQPGGFKLADTQISWRPLDIWRPLPVVLAHPADTMGCGHYRVMQPFNALREAGMVDGALSVGLMHVVDLERYNPDAVILQRQIGEERLDAMRRLKAFSRAFKVYELDDYLPNLPMKSVHRQHMPKDIVKSLRRGLSYVDRFVVSTEVMAEAFVEFHSDVRVVKNRLDPRWWGGLPASARRVSKKPRVGWAGGSSHTGDLEMIIDVVKELSDEVEWVFFGMCPEKLKPYVHEFHVGVEIEAYPKALASLNLDLALAPVEQNLFNECKSNLRLLEYGICGFPVICSDVRCYQGDGLPVTRVKNRFRDWVDAIRAHVNELDFTAKAGDELRAAVTSGWMLEGDNLDAWRKAWLPD